MSTLLFALIGILLLDFMAILFFLKPAWLEYVRIQQLMKTGYFTKGPIIDYNQKKDEDLHTTYAPIVKLTTQNGQELIIESDDYSSIRKDIGELVTICYEAEYPANAIINPQSLIWSHLCVMIFVSIIILGITIGVVFFSNTL
uniref:DUF3592 domain-containing protein n=1 Tax=Paraflavitalea devenefica TaxID=2716334 RepID=UPI0037435F3C